MSFQDSKELIRNYYDSLEREPVSDISSTLEKYTFGASYLWRGMHPFHELQGSKDVAEKFWSPLRVSFSSLQRRVDIFFAGYNEIDGFQSEWVCSMGHFMGIFENPWLDIPPTGKIVFIRYAEFNKIQDGKISETAFFFDILHIMSQAGMVPLPHQTGADIIAPGPKNHDGLLFHDPCKKEGGKTLSLINAMINNINLVTYDSPYEELAQTWHENMIWWGPSGIGSCYTFDGYIAQHQQPFRTQLKNRKFNGHLCRIAEGNFGGFFGWPNLTITTSGKFLGLPPTNTEADMRVVDIYARNGEKLEENWVFIDILHFLNMQGIDILATLKPS